MSSLNINLLNSALSAMMGTDSFVSEKVIREQDAYSACYRQIDLKSFHQANLVGGNVYSTVNQSGQNAPLTKQAMQIYVITLRGKAIVIDCEPNYTVNYLKELIQIKYDISPEDQRLIFAGEQLTDGRTLADYNIQKGSTIYMILRLCGGGCVISYLPSSALDPRYDYDFTHIRDIGVTYMRGKVQYQRPCGWQRFALKVSEQYDNGDDTWLGTGGTAWPVSYHGTAKYHARSISQEGYLLSKGKRFAFGRGIYSTPDINIAERYATEFEFDGRKYVIVIQNRVNPKSLVKIEARETGVGEYWISKEGKDVRPYGICIKEKY
ncbi:7726_t:CDS:1 [Paraglomus occultum]|uniref:7726_t:CDS:1 n=1 Tax=Paraglomus occultum TaxID=144539 RepID=A0A9N9D4A4_9GLOM|nr:7726_t:CDS:1 [Paraglomus occultum]